MKVLFITPYFPLPAESGTQIATLEVLRAIHRKCELHVLAPESPSGSSEQITLFRQALPQAVLHLYKTAKRKSTKTNILVCAANACLTGHSFHFSMHRDPAIAVRVRELLGQQSFEVIHCEWAGTADGLMTCPIPVVVRALDIQSVAFREDFESVQGASRIRRRFWHSEVQRFRMYEHSLLRKASLVIAISRSDEALLKSEGIENIVTIPPAFHVPIEPGFEDSDGEEIRALYLGRLDLTANKQAFLMFAKKIWPLAKEVCAKRINVIFAGGHPDEDTLQLAEKVGIEVRANLGNEQVERLLREAHIVLAPQTSGTTGVLMKTLVAMAYGKPVLGFPQAFRGIAAIHKQHAVIANTPEEFATALTRLGELPGLRCEMGRAARRLVQQHFDPSTIASCLIHAYGVAAGLATKEEVAIPEASSRLALVDAPGRAQ